MFPEIDQISDLSKVVVGYLLPYLPMLLHASGEAAKKVGEKAAEELGKGAGESSWNIAKSIWERLWPSVQKSPAADEAARDLALAPKNSDLEVCLRVQIAKLLQKDEDLTREIASIAHSAPGIQVQKANADGPGAIAVVGNVTNSPITTHVDQTASPPRNTSE
jgi:hypothetical protein